jgi:hypothetical protein
MHHDAVRAQAAVNDVLQLCHHSNPRVLAPFKEFRSAFHLVRLS